MSQNYLILIKSWLHSELTEISYLHKSGELDDYAYNSKVDAIHFINKFMDKMFEKALLHYNDDEEKAYDKYIFERNLDYLDSYLNGFYFVVHKKTDEKYKQRKELNIILNKLKEMTY